LLAIARKRYPYPYPYYPLFVLAIFTGLRRGELCALHWGDVVLEVSQPTVQVRKSIYRGKLYPPKTQSSIRDVPLFSWPLLVLREWRQASPFSQDSDPVFPTVTGNLLHPDNMLKRYFYPTLKAAGLRRIRFHDLRGTYASLMVNWGFAPKQLQQWMGHASFEMTMDIYAKCLREVPERFHHVDGFITKQFTDHSH
jgi:integrase